MAVQPASGKDPAVSASRVERLPILLVQGKKSRRMTSGENVKPRCSQNAERTDRNALQFHQHCQVIALLELV